jgi:hypothetical protein
MRKNYLLCFLFIIIVNVTFSQRIEEDDDTINDHEKINKLFSVFKGFKISGFVQAQYQYFFIPDTIGGATPYFATFAGGNFAGRWSNNRFMIRRGRLKITHSTKFTEGALSIDATERGIGVKDLYVKGTEPWLGAFSLTAGIQNRPFGFEIGYSSALRETPERSRVIQTIFPYERDLGAVLSFQMPEKSPLNFLKIDLGILNGNAINYESDAHKDFVGRIKISNPVKSKFIDYSIGFSVYYGYLNHISNVDGTGITRKWLFRMGEINDTASGKTVKGFIVDSTFGVDKNDSVKNYRLQTLGAKVERNYMGVDAQVSFNFPWGKTTLRGEYIWGVQPASLYNTLTDNYMYNSMTSFSPTGPANGISFPNFSPPQANYAVAVKPTENYHHTFVRKFVGYYVYFIQDILKTGHQIVVKFDYYDPNSEVSGKEIDLYYYKNGTTTPIGLTALSPADVAYWTIGFGYNYYINKHLSVMLYYEMINNEITAIPKYNGDLIQGKNPSAGYDKNIKDNNLTVRMQYKF